MKKVKRPLTLLEVIIALSIMGILLFSLWLLSQCDAFQPRN